MASASTVERAYQLAHSGQYTSVAEIRTRLRKEGCEQVSGHLAGRQLQQELRDILRRSQVGAR